MISVGRYVFVDDKLLEVIKISDDGRFFWAPYGGPIEIAKIPEDCIFQELELRLLAQKYLKSQKKIKVEFSARCIGMSEPVVKVCDILANTPDSVIEEMSKHHVFNVTEAEYSWRKVG